MTNINEVRKGVDSLGNPPKKTKTRKIGRRGKTMLAILIAVMFVSIASAAIIPHFGKITTTATVDKQAVELSDGIYWHPYDEPVTHTIPDVSPGGTYCFNQWIRSSASVPVNVTFTNNDPTGITTKYYKPTEYTFAQTVTVSDGTVGDLEVIVAEDGDWMVWTFDFPVELFTGDGDLNLALIIALDGDGEGPTYQIHNNDGTDATYGWGTWLMSPWGPTINDGWMGWHSGDTNIPVTDLAWVEAIGQRNTPWKGIVSGDGVMEIRILKSVLGNSFHWAANPTVGSGFYAPAYDVDMEIPDTASSGFGWGTPIVNMSVPNYIGATIREEFTSLTLQPGQQLLFDICHTFDLHIGKATYTLNTIVDATEST